MNKAVVLQPDAGDLIGIPDQAEAWVASRAGLREATIRGTMTTKANPVRKGLEAVRVANAATTVGDVIRSASSQNAGPPVPSDMEITAAREFPEPGPTSSRSNDGKGNVLAYLRAQSAKQRA